MGCWMMGRLLVLRSTCLTQPEGHHALHIQVLVPPAMSDVEKTLLYQKGGKLEHLFSRSIWPSGIALGQTLVENPSLGEPCMTLAALQ